MKLLILGLCLAATVTGKQGLFFGAKRDFVVPSRPHQAHEVDRPAAASSDRPVVASSEQRQQLENFPQSRGPVAAPAQDTREKVLQGLQQQEQELHNLLAEGIERKLDEHDSHVSRGQQGSGLQRPPRPALRGSEPSAVAGEAPRRIQRLHPGMLKKAAVPAVPAQSTVRQSPKLDDISRQIDELLRERARLSAQANSIIKTSAKPGSSRPVQESFSVTTPANIAAPSPTPRPAPAVRAPTARLAPVAPKPSQRRVSAPPPSRNRFQSFESLPSGAVRTIQSNAPRTVSIEVSGVEVPKFSKMVSNRGLNLLTRDETVIPVEKMEEVVAAAPPAPAIKGFRVKGDLTNRVIFLNVAALGLQGDTNGLLRLGDMELIPIEEHTRFDNTVEPDTSSYISRDALSKMVNTHIMHQDNVHQRVSLPAFQSDRRLADQLPARFRQQQNVPVYRAQEQHLRPVQQQLSAPIQTRVQQSAPIQTRVQQSAPIQTRVQQSIPIQTRQQQSARIQTRVQQSAPVQARQQKQRPANRKSPVFFSRFGGLKESGVDVTDARPVVRQQAQEQSNVRELQNVANTERQQGFSSFPQTSRGQTPSRQLQAAPQQLPRASKQLGEFDVYLDTDSDNQQQSRFSSFLQQPNSLSQQPTRRLQQQEPVNRIQQQETSFIQQREPLNRFQQQPNNRIQQQQTRQQQNTYTQQQEPINRFQQQNNFDSFQQQPNNRIQQQQPRQQQHSFIQGQEPINRFQQNFDSFQQQPNNRFQQPQQQNNFDSYQQQQPDNRFQQQPDNRFEQPNSRFQQQQQRQQDNRNNFQNEPAQLDPRIQAQIDQQQKAPGVESVLRQQEELRALNQEHSDWNDKLNRENNYVPQQQTRQQQQPRFSTRLDQQQQQYQPQQRQEVPQFQQQQYQPQQQQPDQRHQTGLEQHARFVQELTAAQNALSSLS